MQVTVNNKLELMEGQFKDDELHGFGRKVTVEWQEGGTGYRTKAYIGNWDNGKEDGYGRLTIDGLDFKEGIFEASNFNMVAEGFKSFDPSEELCDLTLKMGRLFSSKQGKNRIMNFNQFIVPSDKWSEEWKTNYAKFDSWKDLKVEGEE